MYYVEINAFCYKSFMIYAVYRCIMQMVLRYFDCLCYILVNFIVFSY